MKTPEELEQYIFSYKEELISKSNIEKDKLFDRANSIAEKLSAQLITISVALLTILGGFIASSDSLMIGGEVKTLITLVIVFLLISIGLGFLSNNGDVKFWNKLAKSAHEKARLVTEDNSTTYDELDSLRKRIIEMGNRLPTHSPILPGILQTTFFAVGLSLLFVVIMIFLYQ